MSHKLVSLYIGEGEYYTRTDVDNVLAEKDQEIAELKLKLENLQNTYKESVEIKVKIWERCKKAEADAAETLALLEERNKQIGELNAKLEDAKATAYAESVDAGMRERRLRRLLWHAIALFCARSCEYFNGIMSHCLMGQEDLYKRCEEKKNKYLNAVNKCRAKEKEYK